MKLNFVELFASFAVPVGELMFIQVIAQANCPDASITNIRLVGPIGISQTAVEVYDASLNQYSINVTWTPNIDNMGANILCAQATDSVFLTSSLSCYKILVNVSSPVPIVNTNMPRGILSAGVLAGVGGFISFTVNFNIPIVLPTSPAFIRFLSATTNAQYLSIDSRTAVITNNITLTFKIPVGSLGSGAYYITFDYGVVLNTQFCKPISNKITSKTFWPVRVSTPGLTTVPTTSTTTTTTTTTFPIIMT